MSKDVKVEQRHRDAADEYMNKAFRGPHTLAEFLARFESTLRAPAMQHAAYFDEGEFHWMSGIAPRDCELFSPWQGGAFAPAGDVREAGCICGDADCRLWLEHGHD